MLCLFIAPKARASEWNQETILTFSAPVRLPHIMLPAGTYIFELANSLADRNIVMVYNADRSQLLDIIMTNADYRLVPTSHTIIKFAETRSGRADAIKEWFYPGDNYGHEIPYPKHSGVEHQEVTARVMRTAA